MRNVVHGNPVLFCKRLRMYRAASGLSQLEVERRAQLTRGQYWRIENNYDTATPAELRRIAKALGIEREMLTAPAEARIA